MGAGHTCFKGAAERLKKAASIMLCLVLLGICLFSGWKVLTILWDYRQSEASYTTIADAYIKPTPQPSEPENDLSADAFTSGNVEMKPVETAPIAIDFAALLADCPDVVGWLYCPDTPINYPVVQAEDNNFYLRRLLDGTWNSSGSIFMDYRCPSDFSTWNSIVYGHNMKNDAMFGTLQDYKEQAYYDTHPVLYLLTPEQDYKIELIGGYTTSGTSEDTYGLPDTQDGRDELVAKARQQSTFQTDTAVNDGGRLITLSTCAYEYDNARYVLVGILRPMGTSEKGRNDND